MGKMSDIAILIEEYQASVGVGNEDVLDIQKIISAEYNILLSPRQIYLMLESRNESTDQTDTQDYN